MISLPPEEKQPSEKESERECTLGKQKIPVVALGCGHSCRPLVEARGSAADVFLTDMCK